MTKMTRIALDTLSTGALDRHGTRSTTFVDAGTLARRLARKIAQGGAVAEAPPNADTSEIDLDGSDLWGEIEALSGDALEAFEATGFDFPELAD